MKKTINNGFRRAALVVMAGSLSLMLQACNQTIDARQGGFVQGLFYKLNAEDPFSGHVENMDPSSLGNQIASFYIRGTCDADFKKGLLDGPVVCKADSGAKVLEVHFVSGKQDGAVSVWDKDSGVLTARLNFKDWMKNGVHERYNPKTGKMLSKATWNGNVLVGEQKIWDVTGETLLTDLTWIDGKETGYSKQLENDQHYKDGQLDGVQRRCVWRGHFGKFEGNMLLARNLGAGFYAPLIAESKDDYECTEETYKNGMKVKGSQEAIASSPATVDKVGACVDGRIDAFRKEKGADVPIVNDMLMEWKAACEQTTSL